MAWERKFEERLWRIREKELSRQEMTYWMKVMPQIGQSVRDGAKIYFIDYLDYSRVSFESVNIAHRFEQCCRNIIPLLFALASFGHYTVIRNESLTPSIAFTAVSLSFISIFIAMTLI